MKLTGKRRDGRGRTDGASFSYVLRVSGVRTLEKVEMRSPFH